MKIQELLGPKINELNADISEQDFAKFKRKAAVSLILRHEENPEILFIHRTERIGDPWSGHIAFPGGGYEMGDENLRHTSMRETFEEVGIDLTQGKYLGRLARLQLKKVGSPIDFGLECHVFFLERQQDFELSTGEVREAFWLPQKDLFHPSSIIHKSFQFEKQSHELPSLELKGKTIWGLTYVLLSHYQKLWGDSLSELPEYSLYK